MADTTTTTATLGTVPVGTPFTWDELGDTQQWTIVRRSAGTGRNAGRVNLVVTTTSYPGESFRMAGEKADSPVTVVA